jgi:hypothetical protein
MVADCTRELKEREHKLLTTRGTTDVIFTDRYVAAMHRSHQNRSVSRVMLTLLSRQSKLVQRARRAAVTVGSSSKIDLIRLGGHNSDTHPAHGPGCHDGLLANEDALFCQTKKYRDVM